jgi:predicted Zn-dependent protease
MGGKTRVMVWAHLLTAHPNKLYFATRYGNALVRDLELSGDVNGAFRALNELLDRHPGHAILWAWNVPMGSLEIVGHS